MAGLDISGQRFGRLTAVRDSGKRIGTAVVWQCRCDCGQEKLVQLTHLRRGSVKSCGCLRRARAIRIGKNRRRDSSEIVRLRRLGFTFAVIARMVGRCVSRVHLLWKRWNKEHWNGRGRD